MSYLNVFQRSVTWFNVLTFSYVDVPHHKYAITKRQVCILTIYPDIFQRLTYLGFNSLYSIKRRYKGRGK